MADDPFEVGAKTCRASLPNGMKYWMSARLVMDEAFTKNPYGRLTGAALQWENGFRRELIKMNNEMPSHAKPMPMPSHAKPLPRNFIMRLLRGHWRRYG